MTDREPNAWWNTLRHEGVLVSPIVLDDWLPDGPIAVEDRLVDRLRQAYYRFTDDPTQLRPFLDALLEDFLGHSKPNWRKEHDIPDRFKHQGKKPNRVLLNAGKEHQPRFIVLIDDEHVADADGKPRRLGIHSGRRKHADLLRLMRATDVKLGILTNGHHVRLVYGGMDHESWAEWSSEAWFQGGDGRLALHGLFTLLGARTLAPDSESDKNELLVKVQESRDRQADLSHVMGTQIREAVELLIEELTDSLATRKDANDILAPLKRLKRSKDEELQALYQGSIRCIMRLIVQLYAESRSLLPKQERLYYESYSVEGLYQLLKRAATDGREEELRSLRSAWPRLLASWRAIHDGSIHKDLQVQSYGGQLFRSYAANPDDPVLAAIHVLEDPRVHVSDWAIREILEKLRVGKYKVGRGKWRKGPVDFSDLRTEYIGMMYEGLLDYDLREARQEDGGIVFLGIGDQPALPLNVLEAQKPDDIKRLIKEQSKKNKGAAEAGDTAEAEAEADEASEEAEDEPALGEGEEDATEAEEATGTAEEQFQARVRKWAMQAVELGGLFGCTTAKLKKLDVPQREKLLGEAAHKLILKPVPPGGMYLVRWSGTRKGSGTFYTKPGLAVPTTVRTLAPLVYENHEDREHRIVKRPEEILALKVCDPAMGSGSFLVAALRFLSGALKESFEKYVIPKVEAGELKATETGETAIGLLTERILRTRREDHSGERMESALKRAVVEHCIYGVDLNPLAVELGKLSLWIETMDPTLRFTFLDHKIKCGNGLVGAWKQQASHYPLAAWEREAGDGKTSARTTLVKRIRKDLVVPQLKTYLDGFKIEGAVKQRTAKLQPAAGQQVLLGGTAQATLRPMTAVRVVKVATQTTMDAPDRGASWEDVLAHEMAALEHIHTNPNPNEQEEEYEALLRNDGRAHQKYLLDMWCAVWFWPLDHVTPELDGVLGPREFYADRRSQLVHDTVKRVAAKHRFFHWELEYPDVFLTQRFGFDALVGNPPWETNEAKTQELFLKFDPAFRTLAGQQAKARIKELTADPAVQAEYLDYVEAFLASKHFFSNCHEFNEGLVGKDQKDKWLAITSGSRVLPNGEPTPYARVRGKQNLYVLFAERALAVTAPGAMIGLISPSGLFADTNTRDIREAWLERNTWEWIYCFENRRKIFPIHAQFKFAAYIVQRGGRTKRLRCRFMEPDVKTWAAHDPPYVGIGLDQIERLSPNSRGIVEVQNERDLALVLRIYDKSAMVGKTPAKYAEEFNATSDSDKFELREHSREAGFRPQDDGSWVNAEGHVAYPLYEGRMVGLLQFSKKGYVSGRARSAVWRPIPQNEAALEPQYLVSKLDAESLPTFGKPGVSFMDVTSATNTRTTIVTLSPPFPHNDKAPRLLALDGDHACVLAACMASYAFDFVTRFRLNGTSFSWGCLAELPLAEISRETKDLVRAIQAGQRSLGPSWTELPVPDASYSWHAKMEELDAVVAADYGLDHDDMRWILRPDNTDPRTLWKDYRERLKVLEAAGLKGKWYTLEEARQIRRKAGMAVDF